MVRSSDFDERLLREYYSAPFHGRRSRAGRAATWPHYDSDKQPSSRSSDAKAITREEWGIEPASSLHGLKEEMAARVFKHQTTKSPPRPPRASKPVLASFWTALPRAGARGARRGCSARKRSSTRRSRPVSSRALRAGLARPVGARPIRDMTTRPRGCPSGTVEWRGESRKPGSCC